MSDMTSPDPGRPAAAAMPPGPHASHGDGELREQPEAAAPAGEAQDTGAAGADAVAELKDRVAELENLWRRALADADNMRKRHAREIGRSQEEARAQVARELLPVLDNLDRALEHAGTDPGAIIEGVRAVRNQAVDLLSRLGYPRRDDLGAASIRPATMRWPPYPPPTRRRGPWSRWSIRPMATVTANCARRRW